VRTLMCHIQGLMAKPAKGVGTSFGRYSN